MIDPQELPRHIFDRCKALGFALAGICDARAMEYRQELLDWLAAGKHGEMGYMARNTELRVDPAALVPGAKAVICVADRHDFRAGPYPEGGPHPNPLPEGEGASDTVVDAPPKGEPHPPRDPLPEGRGKTVGRIARYARGEDYHKVMRKRLTTLARELGGQFPGEVFRVCVDTAPVLERELAQRAGIGAIGKNTLIIDRGIGSYLLLGEIITTLQLAVSAPAEPDPCGTCTRCIDACPTQAISPWSVDASRCISYLTIEHRSEIDPKFHAAMGDWIFGCDVCQEVCPHNQPTRRTQEEPVNPAYAARRTGLNAEEVLKWEEEDRRAAFAGSAMKRANLEMMKRNARIVLGNSEAGVDRTG